MFVIARINSDEIPTFFFVTLFCLVGFWGATHISAQPLWSMITPGKIEGPYRMSGIEPWSAIYKSNT